MEKEDMMEKTMEKELCTANTGVPMDKEYKSR